MLDAKRIRTERAKVEEAIRFKKSPVDLARYLELDERRRQLLVKTETRSTVATRPPR